MVSQYAMATTVRKVKQENRLRRQNLNQDEEGPYKAIPLSRLASNNRWNQTSLESQQNGQETIVAETNSQVTSAQIRNIEDETYIRNSGQTLAPEYRMPPLYGEEQSSNKTQQANNLQTHNKFPVERERPIPGNEKTSKIPIIHEYKQRSTGRAAIAPDVPMKQQAWIQEDDSIQDRDNHTRSYHTQEIYTATSSGAMPRGSVKVEEDRTKTLTRTYHTIKDMISSRFGPSRKEIEAEPEANPNNVHDELYNSTKSVEEDQVTKKETVYSKRNPDNAINMQQYSKNAYGQYSANYGYQQSTQQNVSLPGQLQSTAHTQPSLPGQGAQLHVTHHTPPGGVQMVHQTQVSGFAQNPSTGQTMQNTSRDYVIQGPIGISNQHQNLHQSIHQGSVQSQNASVKKHVMQMQQATPVHQSQPSNATSYQSPQQLMHQNQMHQSPRFAQQHSQNMHQRQLLQQMHQQQQQPNVIRHFNSNYQHYQGRQSISRSQIDLPSTSRQNQDLRVPGQEIYYHYAQNQGRPPRYGVPQVYMKADANQDSEFQRRNSGRAIEKAASQPQLSFDDERPLENDVSTPRTNSENIQNMSLPSDSAADKERYEVAVEDYQAEFDRKGSQRKDEFRPETSFGVRQEDIRSSKKDRIQEVSEGGSVQKRIEELQKRSEQENFKVANEVQEVENRINVQIKRSDDLKRENTPHSKELQSDKDLPSRKIDLEHGMDRLKIQNQGSGSDYDKTGQSSSNIDSGRGSAVYSSGRRAMPAESGLQQGQDSEWVDIVDSELRSILEPRDVPAMAHSTLSESVSSVTPPLPPLSPHGSPRTPRNRYSASLPYGSKPNYSDYCKNADKRNYPNSTKYRGASISKKEAVRKFSHLFGAETADITSTTTGLDLDSMLDRSDSDLSTNDARTIRKQLEGLENMYSEVLKLLGGSMKKRRKARGLTSYGSVSSLPTSSVSSRPVVRYHDKRRSHVIDDRMRKAKDIKSINKRFQRLESHVVTLARSVAHLSSEMRTQHLMIQEMENIRGEIATLRTQTSMAIVRSQSQPLLKDAELPALSNPSRVKKLTKFFGTEPPLIRLFLRELGYEKYASAFEKEKVGMVELPYLSEERLQKIGIPLGPRLRILQEARISVCKDAVYVV